MHCRATKPQPRPRLACRRRRRAVDASRPPREARRRRPSRRSRRNRRVPPIRRPCPGRPSRCPCQPRRHRLLPSRRLRHPRRAPPPRGSPHRKHAARLGRLVAKSHERHRHSRPPLAPPPPPPPWPSCNTARSLARRSPSPPPPRPPPPPPPKPPPPPPRPMGTTVVARWAEWCLPRRSAAAVRRSRARASPRFRRARLCQAGSPCRCAVAMRDGDARGGAAATAARPEVGRPRRPRWWAGTAAVRLRGCPASSCARPIAPRDRQQLLSINTRKTKREQPRTLKS